MAHLLLIDDDVEVLELNQKYLSGEGFTVSIASDPFEGIKLAKSIRPDCIVLDVMMPGLNGFEVCKQIREFSHAPVIFLTGKGSEEDKVEGFLGGGDDYIVKPYSLKELSLRIQVLIKRTFANSSQKKSTTNDNLLTFDELTIDRLAHKAFFHGEDLQLTNREYEVLVYLSTHANEEVTFEDLGALLFGTYQESDRRVVMVNVSRLRKKMALDPTLENRIETVWSKGYKFIDK